VDNSQFKRITFYNFYLYKQAKNHAEFDVNPFWVNTFSANKQINHLFLLFVLTLLPQVFNIPPR